jgi:hypothetical protein
VTAEQLAQRPVTDTQPEPKRMRAELGPGAVSRLRGRARRPRPDVPLSQLVRVAAIVGWTTALAYHVVVSGVPFDPPLVLLWTVSAAVAFSIGRRAIWTVVMDFVPLAVLLLAWVYLRGAATSFGRPALWTPQITFDKTAFLGVEPTVWLQSHWQYATPRWWDVPIAACYLSFSIVPWFIAAVLWLRNRTDYYRWVGRYLALSFLAFGAFALAPSAPPWAAARCDSAQLATHPRNPRCLHHGPGYTHGGLLGSHPSTHPGVSPYVHKIATRGLAEMHLRVAERLIEKGAGASDLVAAIPSLHAGATMLIAIFMWRRVRAALRLVLVFYPLFMGFTLVYSGEHYVFDILVGWLFAVLVSIGAALLERYRSRRRDVGPTLIDKPDRHSEVDVADHGVPDLALPGLQQVTVASTSPSARRRTARSGPARGGPYDARRGGHPVVAHRSISVVQHHDQGDQQREEQCMVQDEPRADHAQQ